MIILGSIDVDDISVFGDNVCISSPSNGLDIKGNNIFIGKNCKDIVINESNDIFIDSDSENLKII